MAHQSPAHNERLHLSKPQVFVHLSWGLSWSDRQVPRSHTLTYTSKNLKNARESGLFPRQVVPANTNYLVASEPRQHRRQDSSRRHHHYHHHHQHQHHHHHYHNERHQRDADRPRGRSSNSRVLDNGPRLEARRASSAHERGSSAPPPVNDSPWDQEAAPSATIFPRREQRTGNPSHYRLGEDGLPWTADAWPSEFGQDGDQEEPHCNANASHPVTVPLSPPTRRRGVDDPQRTRELESLSMALMTVDNGFENQWWNQGVRESTTWVPPNTDEDEARPLSPADALLLSAAEPPSGIEPQSPTSDSIAAIVSPLSEFSLPSLTFPGNLQRSSSTRSDELWIYK
ncbi:hypothetical protein GGR57DRAFT_190103 [Xylariaceae sp. FL1272]|nr:hypothetical protein GGR57DRAFT_190103 [Xylariaceae sp. FL1272]